MKKSEASELVLTLLAAFPASKAGSATSAVYEQMLADLDVAAARKAVNRIITTSRWLPTVAEIRAAVTDLQLGPMRTGEQAYEILKRAIWKIGPYQRCGFHDPLITRALGIWGSWEDACNAPPDDASGRARFIALYDQLARGEREAITSGMPLPVRGAAEFRLLAAPESKPEPPLPPLPRPAVTLPPAPPPPPPPAAPNPRHRKFTAEELEAELAKEPGKP